jgi:hypothetical protein
MQIPKPRMDGVIDNHILRQYYLFGTFQIKNYNNNNNNNNTILPKNFRACLVQPRERGGEVRGGIFKEGRRDKI